ncbi:hypothetical protein FSP39_006611 [Pinctada imbricata]|uniref:Mab-21-like HhH/H2TH-like domain-containing protein n=1 Tax=Pinctada imbricata TaxID=66713 RepID=A0AA88XSS4_PINIB|nr:hypothetical protein FSP39_006611 [Pinctada imbricata]
MDLPSRLSYLFGTEEHVSVRRQIALLREKLYDYIDGVSLICSGSVGEGVAYPPSDDDLMIILRQAPRVVKFWEEAIRNDDVLMVPSECSPGYCKLLAISLTQLHGGNIFFSSMQWKKMLVSGTQFIHGPCLSRVYGSYEYDFAFPLLCSFWPDVALKWIHRRRSCGWPSQQLIQSIIRTGCHVVPIGNPDSPHCNVEWRISFSLAERSLMHSFNHAQFLTYNLLRLTLKRTIGKQASGVFCSYFMKTTLFYTIKCTPPHNWHVNNIERCFKSCLNTLYGFVECMKCPYYFIQEYNIFKRKILPSNRHQMLDIIRSIFERDIPDLLILSGEADCLDLDLMSSFVEAQLDANILFSYHLLFIFNYFENFSLFFKNSTEISSFSLLYTIFDIFRRNGTIMKNKLSNIFIQRAIVCCSKCSMNLLQASTKTNRQNYYFHRKLQTLLRLGENCDLTTGKLTLASYEYFVGKTKSALSVIRQLYSGYPPYALDGKSDYISSATYIEAMCNKGYTIHFKARNAWMPTYFLPFSVPNAFPPQLRIWIHIEKSLSIESSSYACMLESLCYLHQRKPLKLRKSIGFLISVIDDLKEKDDRIHARMCVGIIRYAGGDYQSACRWLGSALMRKDKLLPPLDKTLTQSALMYVACMLNNHYRL